jgi:type III secretion system (T3SS) SseB-like protein
MTDVIPENYYRETGYIQVMCRDLLLTVASFGKPTPVVLNPGHMLVMPVAPERVKALLDGTLFKQIEEARAAAAGPSTVKIPKGAEIIVGKPKVVPTNLMNKLAEYFQISGNVEQAWLGGILVPSSGQPAHLLVCIRLSKNSQRTFNEFSVDIGPTIRSILGQKEFLDVTDANRQTKELLDKLIPFFPK